MGFLTGDFMEKKEIFNDEHFLQVAFLFLCTFAVLISLTLGVWFMIDSITSLEIRIGEYQKTVMNQTSFCNQISPNNTTVLGT